MKPETPLAGNTAAPGQPPSNHGAAAPSRLPRRALLVLLFALIAFAGIRFSDGHMLLAIASGADNTHAAFSAPGAQYIWDSPLKVSFLRALPAHMLLIAAAFGILSLLPAAGLLSRKSALFWLTATAVFLTPAFKVSIQNIGVGDGLMSFLVLLALNERRPWPIAACFFLLGLWHPQQSFFIGLSFLVALYCYSDHFNKEAAAYALGGLLAAALIFAIYKVSMGFEYSGRGSYMAARLQEGLLMRNLPMAPVAFAPIVIWLTLVSARPARGAWLLYAWIAALAALSLLTLDVTRVVTLLTLPIVLAGAKALLASPERVSRTKVLFAAGLIFVIPPWSWSGLDWFLWPDVVSDLCKWNVWCR